MWSFDKIMNMATHDEGSASVEVHLHPHLEPLKSQMLSGVVLHHLCAVTEALLGW